MSWLFLTMVVAGMLALPHGWVDPLVPVAGFAVIPVAMVIAGAGVLLIPLNRIGGAIVADLRATETDGRLRNVAEEVSLAIGEPAGRVVIQQSNVPNVGGFPTRGGAVVVVATTGAVERLRRDELEALVAAQLAGMRDPWCRMATRAELAWRYTIVLGFAGLLVSAPISLFVSVAMLILPRSVEATRDLCADVAAISTTRHPAALATGLLHLAPAAEDGRQQRLVRRWYLPVSPFLVLPKRVASTTSVSVGRGPARTYTDVDEVVSELRLRADRAAALASGADPRDYTGREYRRRWAQLGSVASSG